MSDSSYNGWTNYETWLVGLYLDGNYDGEGTYVAVLDLAVASANRYQLASALEGFVSDTLPDLSGLAADLVGASLGSVNWDELADAKLEEVKDR